MEFKKYDTRGAYHWAEYEDKNSVYHSYVNKVLEWVKERPVLDIGCGDGLITHLFGNGSVGVDNNATAVNLAHDKGVHVVNKSIYEPFETNFDVIFMGDVIEHLKEWEKAITNVKNAMSEYSILYITTPPADPSGKLQDKFHYFEWTQEEFKTNIESMGFKLVEPIFTNNFRMFGKFTL